MITACYISVRACDNEVLQALSLQQRLRVLLCASSSGTTPVRVPNKVIRTFYSSIRSLFKEHNMRILLSKS